MDWVVYILKCADETLYTGITNDLEQRLVKHAEGAGAKYTRGRGPFTVVYAEPQPDRSAAARREIAIKALSKAGKLELAGGFPPGKQAVFAAGLLKTLGDLPGDC